MTDHRIEDYVESERESNEGHVDTRHKNFECETPDHVWDVTLASTSPDRQSDKQSDTQSDK